MFQSIILILCIFLLVVVIFGIVKHIFSIFFKVAVFLLVLILLFSGLTYLDLSKHKLIGETLIIFGNESEIVEGVVFIDSNEKLRLSAEDLSELDYSKLKEGDLNKISFEDLGKFNLVIFVYGNFTDKLKILEGTKFETYLDLLHVFKNEKIYFYPKTITLSIIERVRN